MSTISGSRIKYRSHALGTLALGLSMVVIIDILEWLNNPGVLELVELILTIIICVVLYLVIKADSVKLKEIEEFVVVCSWCGKVEGSDSYKVSHSICPTCYKEELKNLKCGD